MTILNVNGNEFTVYNLSDVLSGRRQLRPIGAVYLFTRVEANGNHTILYVGQTGDLSQRDIPNHQQLPCVRRHGGNSFCVHYDYDENSRRIKEYSIIQDYAPPCNGAAVAQ